MTKRYKKIVLCVLIGILLIFSFSQYLGKSKENYRIKHAEDLNISDKTVTLCIRCDTILQHYSMLQENLQKETFVPEDGIILKDTTFVLFPGDTAFDLLQRATKRYGIQMEYRGSYTGKISGNYIEGINFLYEFSCGKDSGWMYMVNGDFPNYSCSQYPLKNKDKIVFAYTCERGKDLGMHYDRK